jgi:two-component system NtrC family sensor kinase
VRQPAAIHRFRDVWHRLVPEFWNRPAATGVSSAHQFNYRRIWKTAVLITVTVALLPLAVITMVDYQVTQKAIASEFLLRTARTVANTRRSIGFFMNERRSALEFIVRDNPPAALQDTRRLGEILGNLKQSFGGGFMDLGVIDPLGRQLTYVGPFDLEGRDYHGQPWFQQVLERGVHISDVFLGYRQVPHLVIAVKGQGPDGSFYILRASLGIEPFERLLAEMELSGLGDAFIINREGILQTPSRYHGQVLERMPLPVPQDSAQTEVYERKGAQGDSLVIGYRFLEDTPFILMIVKNKADLMAAWYRTRLQLIAFIVVSVTVILAVVLGIVTAMVRRIYEADQRRVAALHQAEYANKLASIGRMAAGVAHEINNPLAIINEKAGLIQDLFLIRQAYSQDPKLLGLLDSILASVKRAGGITKRLLAFARNLEAKVESIDLADLIQEVLSFLGKEAQHRGIAIQVEVAADMPRVELERGKLQQIFLNIINNAMAAVADGGRLDVRVRPDGPQQVAVDFIDDGCGIPREDLSRIFEPFFSTKANRGGTGLGLSITYNLTQEIGGRIVVESEIGQGTRFTVFLPLKQPPKGTNNHACIAGG